MNNILYFSPTGGTKKILEHFFENPTVFDCTLPQNREKIYEFTPEDVVVIGFPVYAGRIPNLLLSFLSQNIIGNSATAIAVVTFGNRAYDDALLELCEILQNSGFNVISAGAFITEHSFSNTLACGRPDSCDLEIVHEFAQKSLEKIHKNNLKPIGMEKRELVYYKPKTDDGVPINILKVIPKTNDNCINCGACATLCPMGSILNAKTIGKCIKCCACVKNCSQNARFFDDAGFLYHKEQLERKFMTRVEPSIFF